MAGNKRKAFDVIYQLGLLNLKSHCDIHRKNASHYDQECEFLMNKINKQRFVNMLGEMLEKNNCKSYYASDDSDLLIVKKAVVCHCNEDSVGWDNTDMLVLLCYHATLDTCSLLFKPEPKRNAKKIRVWDIQAVKQQLGAEVCKHILFLHSFLGCDTTSRLHGLGKGNVLKKFREKRRFAELARVLHSQLSLKQNIIAAGEEALIILYNGKGEKSLDSLRYRRYCDKVASSSCYVHPQTLPPTSSAAKYHSLRVYFQIRQWQGTEAGMSPQDWGWKESDGTLIPVTTDLDPAPNELLRIVRCNCLTDCSTLRCSCKKHGLNCSVACGNCRGSGCCNSNPEMDFDETE